jgi:hypothetical protein
LTPGFYRAVNGIMPLDPKKAATASNANEIEVLRKGFEVVLDDGLRKLIQRRIVDSEGDRKRVRRDKGQNARLTVARSFNAPSLGKCTAAASGRANEREVPPA